jgi:heme-degrading monooxygenase HmoA
MVIIVFRSTLRADADLPAVEAMGVRMYELASAMPGFRSYKDFASTDGESLTLVEFDDEASLAAWRDHPEHREVQAHARAHVFEQYQITVCAPTRAYRFARGEGRVALM